MEQFTLEVMQAINDWQRGGNHAQKIKRGDKLKESVISLEDKYRTCDQLCYRQEAHEADRLWSLLADNCLPETIAAWTIDDSIAKDFKGGVAPDHLRAIIFAHTPSACEVIINLNTVYASSEFEQAKEKYKTQIDSYHSGIGKYSDSQKEVVLELTSLDTSSIHCLGGFSGSVGSLALLFFGYQPNSEEIKNFEELIKTIDVNDHMPWWLSSQGTESVLKRMAPKIIELKNKKNF
ncbi:hypothetical protein A9993_08420 [Rahnella victoriana]|uniref:hypothetical protein n=1 Tax=Rahnella victoriana TaxID=1510570 RepID=UPI000BB1B0C5|nr:hypothetical protein [Rahnella victoriana]PBI79762.1 hypothetical protein A9993_08420 [Rahnella victoriana]